MINRCAGKCKSLLLVVFALCVFSPVFRELKGQGIPAGAEIVRKELVYREEIPPPPTPPGGTPGKPGWIEWWRIWWRTPGLQERYSTFHEFRYDLDELQNILKQGYSDPNKSGKVLSPLRLAAEGWGKESVGALLQNGADPRLRDARGKTPADYAKEEGQEDLARQINCCAAARVALARKSPVIAVTTDGRKVDLTEELRRIAFAKTDNWAGGREAHEHDGSVFGNQQKNPVTKNTYNPLPVKDDPNYYTEFVHRVDPEKKGAERIVIGKEGDIWFTDDHYYTFMPVLAE